MTEPQVWVLIGVFGAIMLGGFTLSTTLTMSTVRSAVGGLEKKMDAKFVAVDVRFDAVNTKLEHLDRDVSALMRREFGFPGE